ncbi:hypothetical protein [Flavobacterium panacagri]|uniref:hypothetical protein n=1 Tax=Flavobacterium panacagri TaxID=3034146 RepID=UPI0025A58669|nr:hypothetical protein [Flavobacterium panacagri]
MSQYQKNHLGIYKLIYNGFKNEIALENHIAEKLSKPKGFVPFKVLQFSSIFLRPGFFYFAFIYALCFFVVLLQFVIGVLFFGFCLIRVFTLPKSKKNLIITSKSYRDIMSDAISQLNLSQNDFVNASIYNLIFLVKKNRLINYFFFLIGFTRYAIINSDYLFVFLLNYKDLLKLYLLSVYITDNPEVVVLTEDHYQRFAFIISNLGCLNFVIVQHGYIDDSVKFPSRFGKIDKLLLRDIQFLKSFEIYYKVNSHSILLRNTALIFSDKNVRASCFLASSSPFIDSEIKFAQIFKNKFDAKLIVKRHPKHVYNREKLKVLLSFADEEWTDAFHFPNSSLFISHGSFLEFDYKSAGTFTFKLSDFSNVEAIFEDPSFKKAMILLNNKQKS